jgi:uncharacterized protein YjbJ (UPF0337 family)
LKQQFAELTDNDLFYVEGREDELQGLLQQKLGKNKDEVSGILASLAGKDGHKA